LRNKALKKTDISYLKTKEILWWIIFNKFCAFLITEIFVLIFPNVSLLIIMDLFFQNMIEKSRKDSEILVLIQAKNID